MLDYSELSGIFLRLRIMVINLKQRKIKINLLVVWNYFDLEFNLNFNDSASVIIPFGVYFFLHSNNNNT